MKTWRWRRPIRAVALVGLFLVAAVYLPWPRLLALLLAPDPGRLERPADVVILDRSGVPLLHAPDGSGTRGQWLAVDRFPAPLVEAVLAAEDARYYQHPGFDLSAILRAAWDNLTHRRIVSGASTVTEQLVRMVHPRPRTFRSKLVELVQAAALEKLANKREILEQYLNRVPMPGARRGMAAGSWFLFSRDLSELTLSECALLAGIPQAPGRLDPRRGVRALLGIEKRRRWVLQRMNQLGFISRIQYDAALAEVPRLRAGCFPFRAPHLVNRLLKMARDQNLRSVQTTLDSATQALAEGIVASHRNRLETRAGHQTACLVLDTQTRDVVAWVGSSAWSARALGFNDGVLARRSAGSTLKPFVYALALEKGLTLATPLPDVARNFTTPQGDYDPQNFDRRHFGPVPLRSALAGSLNTAAVEVARRVGVEEIRDLLTNLSLLDHHRRARDYGIGIVIGNVEVTLLDLVNAYATLGCEGVHRSVRCWMPESAAGGERWADGRRSLLKRLERTAENEPGRRVMAADTAYLIGDVLRDPAARLLTFGNHPCFDYPFGVALKTGTSTSYRDCWAVGFAGRYTVGVWTGNFEGSPTALSGAMGAAPVLHDLLVALYKNARPSPVERPAGIEELEVCTDSGQLPTANCPHRTTEMFLSRRDRPKTCTWHGGTAGPATSLGSSYAGWLQDRQARGGTGRYRLEAATPGAPRLEILYPHAGDRFVLPHTGASPVTITAAALPHRLAPSVRWFVDGQEMATTPPPYRWSWTLTRGHHTLLVMTPDLIQSAAVDVQVE